MFLKSLKHGAVAASVLGALYIGLLALLTTESFQKQVVYLNAIQMTWFKDLNVPELFGFLKNQVTPFAIETPDGETLYAWHILPVGLYMTHEASLVDETPGFTSDVTSRSAFKTLRDDPDSRLVIHMHGAGGTVASGYRCPNYRALSAGLQDKIHVLTFDYRGFGRSTGTPSEHGLIIDAVSVVEWALNVARIPPSRILIYSQSMGTAVNMAVAEHYALQEKPVTFAGHILTAPFVDVATLVSTYSIAGTVPILGPLARFPIVFDYLRKFIQDSWSTKDRIQSYIRTNEKHGRSYHITMLHAEDDYDIPWTHTTTLFNYALNATAPEAMSQDELDEAKSNLRLDLGSNAGSVVEWKTNNGVIREEILKYGLHDVIMGNSIVTLAVTRIFASQR